MQFKGGKEVRARDFQDHIAESKNMHCDLIDLTEVLFLEVVPIVGLACLAMHGGRGGGHVAFVPPKSVAVTSYLARIDFDQIVTAKYCEPKRLLPAVRRRPRPDDILEVTEIRDEASIDQVTDILRRNLSKRGGVGGDTIAGLDAAFGEIAYNVRHHSEAEHGFAAAQAYEPLGSRRWIDVAIGDAGVGLRASLARHDPEDDAHAIELALTAGVSGTDDARGIGLPTAQEEITELGGEMVIYSGTTRCTIDVRGHRTWVTDLPRFPGTLVGVSVPC